MPDAQHLLLFILAGWLLNLTPGPDVLYICTNAIRSGVRAGIVAGLGITAGCFVHVFAAAVGVGALLATSATAFTVLKWIGAAYLVWLGVKTLLARPAASGDGGAAAALAVEPGAVQAAGASGANQGPGATASANGAAATAQVLPAPLPLSRVFLGGFWTNVLNPKVAVFFLAFVPQFIAPDADSKALAFIALGVLFNLNAIPVNSGWALAAAWLARRVRGDASGALAHGPLFTWLDRIAGAMFIGFGLKLAFTDHPTR